MKAGGQMQQGIINTANEELEENKVRRCEGTPRAGTGIKILNPLRKED
jgi:hypothetical protein